jgi:hypothetical protein
MMLRGECLIGVTTLQFSVHGSRADGWTVNVKGPNNVEVKDETLEVGWATLLMELLSAAYEKATSRRLSLGEIGAGR